MQLPTQRQAPTNARDDEAEKYGTRLNAVPAAEPSQAVQWQRAPPAGVLRQSLMANLLSAALRRKA